MKTVKERRGFKPSKVLWAMLLVVTVLLLIFIALEKGWLDWLGAGPYKVGMEKASWVPALGVYFAVVGWIINAIVTMRNSVKQHTINTLLQTRLSATYMERATAVRVILDGYSPLNRVPVGLVNFDFSTSANIDYILNYIEFMAVGIIHGDLHEQVLRDSMRGIVLRFVGTTHDYIDDLRIEAPRTFKNLLWLYERWSDDPAPQAPAVTAQPPAKQSN